MGPVTDPAPKFYIAIDPGKATGWAWTNDNLDFGFGETIGRFVFEEQFREWTSTGVVPEIVIENWGVRDDTHKLSRQADPYLIIGYIEGLAHQNGWSYATQEPFERDFADLDKLKAIGWEATTKEGHARVAAQHLLTYLAKRYKGRNQIGWKLLKTYMEKSQ